MMMLFASPCRSYTRWLRGSSPSPFGLPPPGTCSWHFCRFLYGCFSGPNGILAHLTTCSPGFFFLLLAAMHRLAALLVLVVIALVGALLFFTMMKIIRLRLPRYMLAK